MRKLIPYSKKSYEIQEQPKVHHSFFLDSGAFSIQNSGIKLSIDDYIAYIKQNSKYITHYANFDVIFDAKASLKNLRYMEAQGLKPIPVFHRTEDYRYLLDYMEEYDYIALGGMASAGARIAWLDTVWGKYLTDKEGRAKVMVHGFGMSSIKLLWRYPWWSVDSSTWIKNAAYGRILLPHVCSGKISYRGRPIILVVTEIFGQSKIIDIHYKTVPKELRIWLDGYLDTLGTSYEKLAVSFEERKYVNAVYFRELEKAVSAQEIRFNKKNIRRELFT